MMVVLSKRGNTRKLYVLSFSRFLFLYTPKREKIKKRYFLSPLFNVTFIITRYVLITQSQGYLEQ